MAAAAAASPSVSGSVPNFTDSYTLSNSILTVAPGDVKVAVPITGQQLPGWNEVNDTAGVARQLLKATGSPHHAAKGHIREVSIVAMGSMRMKERQSDAEEQNSQVCRS